MKTKLLIMDVDGTLTDGKIYIGPDGECMKAFDVKDGYGIVVSEKKGIVPVIITGRQSQIVAQRAKELHIEELYQGVEDKLSKLKEVAERYHAAADEIAYIGDDLNDLACIEYCGITACPQNAIAEVKNRADYVCLNEGGHGAVREFIGYILQLP